MNYQQLPDNTPIIVGAGQHTEHITDPASAPLSGPMDLAAQAARIALDDAGGKLRATDIDAIAAIRLFSDSAPAWACPFGGSDNPPESIASRLGASPRKRIYSDANGAQPLQIMAELFTGIASGEIDCALLAGAEAIASQRHAQRSGIELDWAEQFDLPMDSRLDLGMIATPAELASGMYLPVHYYALIENHRASQQRNTLQQHREQMAKLLASFSTVASHNPYAYWRDKYSASDLLGEGKHNYPISLPYSKLLVAQDAVNQAAALVLTSVGKARAWGISPSQWIFLQGYAEGADQYVSQRVNPGTSEAMRRVFERTLNGIAASGNEFDFIDLYSCFPCAVEAACDVLSLPIDGSRELTVTGGLPFFGGPGNNYSMHALAEMTRRLRGGDQRALVTANGGILSKHAAVVLANNPNAGQGAPLQLEQGLPAAVSHEDIPTRPLADSPRSGTAISYTVIYERKKPDLAIVLGETDDGERFLANSDEPAIVEALKRDSPIGRRLALSPAEQSYRFQFAD